MTMLDPRCQVRDVMSRGAISVGERVTLRSLSAVLAENNVGVVLVARPDGSAGIASERDVVHALANGADPDEVWAGDVMVEPLVIADPDESVADVAMRMAKERVRHVAVVDHGHVVGVVSARDVLPALASSLQS